uniref:YdcF family protein n=1 Tax=Acetivibrio cellulolyticus TaxID=35830 RepID=UPI0002481C8C|nr:YdcF family protein [Acetivibrio cellulolyticus]
MKQSKMRYKLLLLAGVLGIIDSLFVSAIVPKIFNLEVLLPGITGLAFVVYAVIKLKKPAFRIIKHDILRRIAACLTVFCIIFFILIESIIVLGGVDESNTSVDYVVVLGAGLDSRDKPSGPLRLRLDKCIDYVSKNPFVKIIVSGGQGFDEEVSEAFAMKEYLVSNGVNQKNIIMEEQSTNTLENIKNTKALIENLPDEKSNNVLIVTNRFHLFRAKMLAERFGFKAYGMPCITPLYTIPNNYLREFFAVIKSWVFDK